MKAARARLAVDDKAQAKRLAIFSALLGWCAVLLAFRLIRTESLMFSFLVWNLMLACVPFVAAILFARMVDQGAAVWKQLAWFGLWLAFLPNAPYIVTDFMHLNRRSPMPVWYDVALLGSFAATGLLLGYSSLAEVQRAITGRFSAVIGWMVATAALFLSAFGIYLGRFLRWNSWDALTRPLHLWQDIVDRALNPSSHPRAVGVTVIYGTILLLGYVAMRVLQPVMATSESPRQS